MSLLRETVNDYIMGRLEETFAKLEKGYEKIFFTYNRMLKEGVTDELPDDIEGAITELTKRWDAARRAVSIINGKNFPKNSESFVVHRRRIFQNMNRIKALQRMLEKKMMAQLQMDDDGNDLAPAQTQGQPQTRPQAQPQQQFNQQTQSRQRVGESYSKKKLNEGVGNKFLTDKIAYLQKELASLKDNLEIVASDRNADDYHNADGQRAQLEDAIDKIEYDLKLLNVIFK